MKKNKIISMKFSLIYEGETEYLFINFLKNKLYDINSYSICKLHSQNIKGTISEKNIHNKNNCCKQFYLFDKDKMDDNKIESIINKINNNNGIAIVSYPSIEIYFLNFFEFKTNWKNLSTKEVINCLKKNCEKYDKSNLKDFFNEIEKKWNYDECFRKNFNDNLNKYKDCNNKNNMIDIINFWMSKKHNES